MKQLSRVNIHDAQRCVCRGTSCYKDSCPFLGTSDCFLKEKNKKIDHYCYAEDFDDLSTEEQRKYIFKALKYVFSSESFKKRYLENAARSGINPIFPPLIQFK